VVFKLIGNATQDLVEREREEWQIRIVTNSIRKKIYV
jgi:hypothetical protein